MWEWVKVTYDTPEEQTLFLLGIFPLLVSNFSCHFYSWKHWALIYNFTLILGLHVTYLILAFFFCWWTVSSFLCENKCPEFHLLYDMKPAGKTPGTRVSQMLLELALLWNVPHWATHEKAKITQDSNLVKSENEIEMCLFLWSKTIYTNIFSIKQKYRQSSLSWSNRLTQGTERAAFQLKTYYVPGIGQTVLQTISSFTPPNNFMKLLFPFYRWGNWEPERFNPASRCWTRVSTSVWPKLLSAL